MYHDAPINSGYIVEFSFFLNKKIPYEVHIDGSGYNSSTQLGILDVINT